MSTLHQAAMELRYSPEHVHLIERDVWEWCHSDYGIAGSSELPKSLWNQLPPDADGETAESSNHSNINALWYDSYENAMDALEHAIKSTEVSL